MADTTFQQRYGPWALVTGASSGIGAQFVKELASRGLSVVLVARRGEKLDALAAEVKVAHGVGTRVVVADLSDATSIPKVQQAVADLEIGLLVNNAGWGSAGQTLLEGDLDRELDYLQLNVAAPLRLTHHFARAMLPRGRGGVILVSSLVGFQGAPYMAAYSANKAYTLALGEALSVELKGAGIDVTVLAPGPTATAMADALLPQDSPMTKQVMGVEPVVAQALRALGRDAATIPGGSNRFLISVVGRLFGRQRVSAMMGKMMRPAAKPAAAPSTPQAAP